MAKPRHPKVPRRNENATKATTKDKDSGTSRRKREEKNLDGKWVLEMMNLGNC